MSTILIVGDRQADHDFLVALFEDAGYRAFQAADSGGVLLAIRAEHPDLVIADVRTPMIDGFELIRQLRADPSVAQTPVILRTARGHEREAQVVAHILGLSGVIAGASEPQTVLGAVKIALGLAPPPDVLPATENILRHVHMLAETFSQYADEDSDPHERLSALIALSLQLASELDMRIKQRLLTGVVNASLTRRDTLMLQQCAEAIVQHLDVTLARIWTFNQTENVLELEASAGLYTHTDGPHSRIPLGHLEIGQIAQERMPHFTNEALADPRISDKDWAMRNNVVAFGGYPLVLEDRLLGVVGIFATHPFTSTTVDAFASVAHDIALGIGSHKHSEEVVRQLSYAVEHSRVLVVITDLHGAITHVNHKFCEVTGYSFEESIGRNPRFLKSGAHSPEMYQALWARITSGEVWRGEFHNRKKNGEPYWEGTVISPLLDADGRITHFVAVAEDITERKRAEEERENLHAQLAQSQKMESIGRLAGGIAHDFSNLMSVILLHDDSALQALSSGDPLMEPLTEIRKAAERAVTMTQQLMAFSRKRALQTEVLNLNSVIVECEKLVRPLIGEDIHMVFIPGSGLGRVKADRGQLGQIIMNLVVNSRDAMPHGGTLTIETASVELDEVDARQNPEAKPGSYVTLAFRDTGVGMDKETQARVFEPFFTTKEIGKGTGLGLSMVYGIVKQSGGYVTVNSEPGRGAEFKIYLPTVLEATEPVLGPEVAPGQRGVETILVVEDEPALREVVCRILKDTGYRVLGGKDVDEAIQIATQHTGTLDLLLTDVVMPNMSGPQLAEHVQPLHPRMKVLYMSGYPEPGQSGSALAPEMAFIQKPFTQRKLLGRLREVLDGRKLSI